MVLFVLAAAGCSKGYPEYGPEASPYYGSNEAKAVTILATLKQDASGSVYLWSQGERLNLDPAPQFTRQQRVVANVTIYPTSDGDHDAAVNWMEPIDEGILTSDASAPGTDPLDVNLESWMTGVDDGYLTLDYSAWWGEHPVHHDFRLVSGLDPSDPYCLELRHDANGDERQEFAEGVICFDINSLPDTGDESRQITIKWKNTEGKTTQAKFEFASRK